MDNKSIGALLCLLVIMQLVHSTDVTTCSVLSSPGTYVLTTDLTGAPNSADEIFAGSTACMKITSSDVIFDCDGHSMTGSGDVLSLGLVLDGSITNVTVNDCPSISDYGVGVYVSQTNDSVFSNIGVQGSVSDGLYMGSSSNNVITNSVMYGNDYMGFEINDSPNTSITGSSTLNNSYYGMIFELSDNSSLTNSTAYGSGYLAGVYVLSSDNVNISNDTSYNNDVEGFLVEKSNYTTIEADLSYNNPNYGFYIKNSSYNSIENNTAFNISTAGPSNQFGIYLYYSDSNNVSGNILHDARGGLMTANSMYNTISGNSAYNNGEGMGISDNGSLIIGNNVSDNYGDGIDVAPSGFQVLPNGYDIITNNTACGNVYDGIYLYASANDSFANNTICDNGAGGFTLDSTDGTILGATHLFDNNPDMDVMDYSGSQISVSLSDLIFDNPLGNMQNYTTLSINDTLNVGEEYTINWTSNESVPPNQSFAQKFVNISPVSGTPSIDSVVWSWTDAEAVEYDPSTFELWSYDIGGWNLLNDTPDTVGDTLSFANLIPDSDYAILGNGIPVSNCMVIDGSGYYTLTTDLTGAPNDASDVYGGGHACVKIAASNVIFDCNGHSISNGGAGATYGILFNDSAVNSTAKNCEVSQYYYGIYIYNGTNNSLININSVNNSNTGIYLYPYGSGHLITNVTASGNGDNGLALYGSFTLTDAYVFNNSGQDQLAIVEAVNSLISDINVSCADPVSGWSGINALGSFNDSFSNIVATNCHYGIINNVGGSLTNFTNVTAYNNDYGIWLYVLTSISANSFTLMNSNASNNNLDGVLAQGMQYSLISNVTASDNGGDGIDSEGIGYFDASVFPINDTYIGCNLSGNGGYGFEGSGSLDNSFFGNTMENNGVGFVVDGQNNSIVNNTISGSIGSGMVIADDLDSESLGFIVGFTNETTIQDMHFYNNSPDFSIADDPSGYPSVAPINLSFSDVIFDNPLGNYQNYTNLSLDDIVDNGENYTIAWTANESEPPNQSFSQKFVNISTSAGTPSIDSIVWSWLGSELPGYDERGFEIWEYNSTGWYQLSSNLNTYTHTLSLANLNPESDYGILQGSIPISFAPLINFVPPTPDNATITYDPSILINITINETLLPLGNFTYDWNGTDYTPYDGSLIAMYNFDNISALGDISSQIDDASPSGNNASCGSGSCPTFTPDGKYGGAYLFDGSKDFLTTENTLDSPTFTFSAWVKRNQTASGSNQILMQSTGGTGWSVSLGYDNRIFLGHTGNEQSDSNGLLSGTDWSFVTVSYNGTDEKYYIDGALDADWYYGDYPFNSSGSVYTVGGNLFGEHFNGSMDEVRVYDRALSDSEVNELYLNNDVSDGLVLQYSMDNDSGLEGNNVADLSMYKNNVTCSDCPTWTPDGKYGGAFQFNGSGAYLATENTLDSPTFTFSAWVKKNRTISGSNQILVQSTGFDGWGVSLGYDNRLFLGHTGYEASDSNGLLSGTDWSFVTISYNGSDEKYYIDGALDADWYYGDSPFNSSGSIYTIGASAYGGYFSAPFNGSIDEIRVYNRSLSDAEVHDLYVSNLNKYDTGKWDFITNQSFGSFPVGDYNFTYSGCADDMNGAENCTEREITYRVAPPWIAFVPPTPDDGTITSDKSILVNISVNQTMNPITRLVLDWNGTITDLLVDEGLALRYQFDDNTTDSTGYAVDSGPDNNTATCSTGWWGSCPVWTPDGRYGGAFNFSNSAFFTFNLTAPSMPLGYDPRTMCAWVQRPDADGVIGMLGSWGGNDWYLGKFYSCDLVGGSHAGGEISDPGYWCSVPYDQWKFVCLTYDGTYARLYADGVPVTDPIAKSWYIDPAGQAIVGYTYGWPWNSLMDEFRIYNRSLSSDDIMQLYTNTVKHYGNFSVMVNKTFNVNTPGDITFTYSSCVNDSSGLENCTETRNITYHQTSPLIDFVPQTPDDGAITSNTSIPINITINETTNPLGNVIFDWNGTNESLNLSGLMLMCNLDNVSALGENSTTVVDASQYGNIGTVYGGAAPTSSGVRGGAYTFDGVDGYIDFPSGAMSATDNWAIAAWMNPATLPEGQVFVVYNGNDGNGYGFGINSGNRIYGLFGYVTWIDSGYTLPSPNTWYYIVMTRRSGTTYFSINGAPAFPTTTATPNPPGSHFTIGGILDPGLNPEWYFNGTVDEVSAYNRSLNDSEIQQLYISSLNKYEPGKWDFAINQSFGFLPSGYFNFTYSGCADDINGNENCTEAREITYHPLPPLIDFVPQTPDDGAITSNTSIPINITINETNHPLGYFILDWNGSSTIPLNTVVSASGPQDGDISLSCPSGTVITAYSSKWGVGAPTCGGGDGVDCGNCTIGSRSCTIAYSSDGFCYPYLDPVYNISYGDCSYGNYKPSQLNLTCVGFVPNDTIYNPDLVLMYNFDNVSALGENDMFIRDMSPYGHNATCSDPTCPIWTPDGRYGGAYNFDGVNDWLTTNTNFDNNVPLTFTAWVKRDRAGHMETFMGPRWCNGWELGVRDSNVLYFGSSCNSGVESSGTISDSDWHFVAYSYDGSEVDFYKDGALVDSQPYNNGGNPFTAGTDYVIGTNMFGGIWNFMGKMDEVRLYNRTLLPSEVQQLYLSNLNKYDSGKWDFVTNQSFGVFPAGDYNFSYSACADDLGGAENCTETRGITFHVDPPQITFVPPTPDNGTVTSNLSIPINISINETTYPLGNFTYDWNGTDYTPYDPSLMLMYNFDNFSIIPGSDTVADMSGNGNNATCTLGTNCPAWTQSGEYGGAYIFNGSELLNISDPGALPSGSSPFTMCAWAKEANVNPPGIEVIADYGAWGVPSAGPSIYLGNRGQIYGSCELGAGATGSDIIIPNYWCDVGSNNWVHLCLTYDGTNAEIYSNGQNITPPIPEIWNVTNYNAYLGVSGDQVWYWNGSIDEVRIYNYSLSPEQVNDLYNSNFNNQSGLDLYYDFDDSSALSPNSTEDVSPYSNNATCTEPDCPAWTPDGKYGGAYQFDGVQDYFSTGNLDQAKTVSVWVKRDSINAPGAEGIVDTGDCGGWALMVSTSNNLYIDHRCVANTFFTGKISDTSWHYVTMTYDPSAVNLYIDGKPAGSQPFSTSFDSAGSSYRIGMGWKDFGEYFEGKIDELRVYNRTLSPSEVEEDYVSNLNKYDVGEWDFVINQSFGILPPGDSNLTYSGCADDIAGNENCTEAREITFHPTPPLIDFVPPTPDDGAITSNTSILVNITINETTYPLNDIIFDWNGTNQTLNLSGLMLMYNFDDAPHVKDESSSNNDASCTNGVCPVWTPDGAEGGALNFSGGKYLAFDGNSPSLPSGNSPFTMCAWANSYAGYFTNIIGSYGTWSDNGIHMGIGFNSCDLIGGAGNDELAVTNYWCNLGTNVWTHLCLTYDGTNAELYSDGQNITPPTPKSWDVVPGPSFVGASGDQAWHWDGLIDEFRIYNYSLSPSQVNDLYNFNYPDTGGLVLYYDFNDSSALSGDPTTTEDASMNGDNARCSGSSCPIWTSDGKYGGAYQFDGSSSYFATNLDIQPSAMPNMTFVAWVYPTQDNIGGRQTVFSDDDGGNDRDLLIEWNTPNWAVFTGDTYPNSQQTAPVDLNQWQQVAAVYTQDSVTFYKNGVAYGPYPVSGQSTGNEFTLGKDPGFTDYFNGKIDEAQLYNRTLAPSEIQQLYLSNLNKYDAGKWDFVINQSFGSFPALTGLYNFSYSACADDIAGNENCTDTRNVTYNLTGPVVAFVPPTPDDGATYSNDTVIINTSINATSFPIDYAFLNWNGTNITIPGDTNDLILFYTLDANSPSDTIDSSPYGNNATCTDPTCPTFTSGIFNGGYHFDGTDYLTVPDNPSLDPTDAITMSTWVDVDSYPSYAHLISKGTPDWGPPYATYELRLTSSGNAECWVISTDNVLDSVGTINTGEWHLVTCTYDGSIESIYIDGVLDSSRPVSGAIPSSPDDLVFGSRSSGNPGEFLVGTMDNVRIYNYSLSSLDVSRLYSRNYASYDNSSYYSVGVTPDLPLGPYDFTYFACANDTNQAENCTETRTLHYNSPSCPLINQSGYYQQLNDYFGQWNDASEISPGDWACVKIIASDVVFDCAGYNITAVARPNMNSTFGILLNGSLNNVTIENCGGISNYTEGIYVYQSNNTNITNSTAYGNGDAGLLMNSSNSTSVDTSTFANNTFGIYMENDLSNAFTGNSITGNNDTGMSIDPASTDSNLLSNGVCYNGLDISNSGSSSGSLDRCDSFLSWSEAGHYGCEYSCTDIWHRFFGNASGIFVLGNDTAYMYIWNSSAVNVFFADSDANITWQGLQAIGRNTTNGTSSDDFLELDNAFNLSSYRDNITSLYSTDGTNPKDTRNYTVFGREIDDIPVAGSAPINSSFVTGILWDMSDGGVEYSNDYNQSTVWMVRVNSSTPDVYGTYDFLAQLPYTLSSQTGPNNLVSVYLELQ